MKLVWMLLIILVGLAAGGAYTRLESTAPLINTRATPVYVGVEYSHEFRVIDEGMGIEQIRVWLQSGDSKIELFSETYGGNPFMGADLSIPRRIEVSINASDLGIADGHATLVAEASDFSWRKNTAQVQVPLTIDTKAPRIALKTGLTYVRRGGSELVSYSISEEVPVHGVQMGEAFSPGFPHPEDPGRFVAFYPLPPDVDAGSAPFVVAEDKAGNRSKMGIRISIIERTFPSDKIRVSDGFLERKVPEILGGDSDDLVAAYVKINRDMRAENADQIVKICADSSTERLWRGRFLQLPNSHVGARFAEKRIYTYNDREIDRQVHLGYDLASTAHSEVPASNSGVVAFADTLGIYGQTVIIDHGLSLFSLYGHLSEIAVEHGQVVAQGETIGRTGQTGLAGGDHLHYAMMVAGVFVDPLEWFDERWIKEHIEVKFAVSTNGSNGSNGSNGVH
jgi:murein DD-endopeptidase MepM/ murein hydrolase activator NlpD